MLQDKTVIPNLYLSFKKVIQDPSGPLSEEQLLSHRNQSVVYSTDVYFEFYIKG